MKMRDIRLTRADIAKAAALSPAYVNAIIMHHKPQGISQQGEQLYSVIQMCAAIFRGIKK
ncbi:hypothetical protein JW310_23120 [Enterobacter cloacae subsp. cloacae]|uniref:hypothetical protein n=1 Tax=Enterobacter cloacae TaxID=550 RepID=UPI001C5B3D2B|nr:hypothetical protein [Enterobacter cloacae]ELK6492355.1 hypothetical protein [Enterobacter bugandensis]MBW4199529.1 hypothetical protein [Enterobacter cloacae subsp. cloacae]